MDSSHRASATGKARSLILTVPKPSILRRSRSKKSPKQTQSSDTADIGKLKMGKSVISLLTTTSMYSEFNKLNNDIDDDSADVFRDSAIESEEEIDESPENEVTDQMGKMALEKSFLESEEVQTMTPFQKSVVRLLESKRQVICGVQSSRILSSDKNLFSRAVSLCNKLVSTFYVDSDDELIDDYSCWLLRDVLLQGHLYVTKQYLLFFAYLPTYKVKTDKEVISGSLSMKKRSVTSSFQRYWCVLKGPILSVYNGSTDLYFPLLTINLRYILKVELVLPSDNEPGAFSKLTNIGIHDTLGIDDSEPAIKETALLAEMKQRKSLTTEDTVKKQKIRILTENKTYIFYADNMIIANDWVSKIKTQMFTLKNKDDKVTIKLPLANLVDLEVNSIFDNAENIRVKVLEDSNSYALDDYFFLFFNSCANAVKSIKKAMEISPRSSSDSPKSPSSKHASPKKSSEGPKSPIISPGDTSFGSARSTTISDNYFPAHSMQEAFSYLEESPVIVKNSIKEKEKEAKKVLHKPFKVFNPKHLVKNVIGQKLQNGMEMWSSNPTHYEEINSLERGAEDQYLASPEQERVDAAARFRKHFMLPDSEKLVATYYAYLQRNMPLYGKIYLGSSRICFRSLIPGISTKMILPFYDVENCYKEKNFSFGYSGLVIVINGHEELFFEFSANESRDDCEYLLLKQLDIFKRNSNTRHNSEGRLSDSIKLSSSSNNLSEVEDIRKNEDKISLETGSQVPIIIKDFAFSKSNFKPKQKFKITCLTIGSRGDVQPYLALCKKLIEEGHSPRIATHGEFKDVVESHGIEFRAIAGNPTELMSFMGNHSSISVSFIKDAKNLFTSWIDDLLESSWTACQGSEILIESPSAMAGIHIAEALDIPYFRAFTMPWTRTRAYPHAFIVPESKRGGSYNYFTHVMFENVFWKGISSQVNHWRINTLKLPKTDLYQLQQNKVPFLYNVSPTVLPPSVDFAGWITVTGYWFLEEKTNYKPPEELVKFIANAKKQHKKIVYIGFGSIVVSDPKELTQAVVDAVKIADVRCILNKGWSGRLEEGADIEVELGPEIYDSGSIPHDWLFSHIDAAVHHGGSGTTGASLRAGLPTVIKPFFGDQFFYAQRVEDLNVGVHVKKLNKDSLSKAIKAATTNSRIIENAKAIGEKIRAENGTQVAIQKIYSQLEYAQNLISHKVAMNNVKEVEEEKKEDIDDIDEFMRSSSVGHSRSNSDNGTRKSSGSWLLL